MAFFTHGIFCFGVSKLAIHCAVQSDLLTAGTDVNLANVHTPGLLLHAGLVRIVFDIILIYLFVCLFTGV